jgi:tetratricopeptide (TPR) repeat protein
MSDAPTPEVPSLRDRYLSVIDQIVHITLKGQLRSKEQIYQQLVQEVSAGTGEIFERCLTARLEETQTRLNTETDELKQAKASRVLRALQAIQKEWERYQKEQQATGRVATAAEAIQMAGAEERLSVWLSWVDPNQNHSLTTEQLRSLAQSLNQVASQMSDSDHAQAIQQLAAGIRSGLESQQQLEDDVIRWIYEVPTAIGFEGTPRQWGPWKLWGDRVNSQMPKHLFQAITTNQPITETIRHQPSLSLRDWVELVILLQFLQRGLVTWFEKQPYDSKWGVKQSVATFLTFAVIWGQLSIGFEQASQLSEDDRRRLSQGCFQVMLQILRCFSQQPYFPLYGGVFALFAGDDLKDALEYLDVPLRQVAGTQEKARILTLLGYSRRAMGQYDRAIAFHNQALDIARTAADQICEIANLNHLSRIYAAQKNYGEAISHSQRALILARQRGDRLGEANALTNLGYSEVLAARQLERIEPESYEMPINYLHQGLELSEKLGDRQSQSLCYNSLGIAHVLLEQPAAAISYLEKGAQAAQFSGDLFLQGLNFIYLAEAHYSLGDRAKAVFAAFVGMYLLEQIQANEWRQPAGLLTILQGQLGEEGLQQVRQQYRSAIIAMIGVDGYDHLPTLLEQYKRSLD